MPSLWPAVREVGTIPEPLRILREQGVALHDITDGRLYGEVLLSDAPSPDGGVSYDFYLAVTDKTVRYLLLSIECDVAKDYPVKVTNTLAGTTTQAYDVAKFEEQVRIALNAPATQDLVSRMLSIAAQ
jgi:hypothetical protein